MGFFVIPAKTLKSYYWIVQIYLNTTKVYSGVKVPKQLMQFAESYNLLVSMQTSINFTEWCAQVVNIQTELWNHTEVYKFIS